MTSYTQDRYESKTQNISPKAQSISTNEITTDTQNNAKNTRIKKSSTKTTDTTVAKEATATETLKPDNVENNSSTSNATSYNSNLMLEAKAQQAAGKLELVLSALKQIPDLALSFKISAQEKVRSLFNSITTTIDIFKERLDGTICNLWNMPSRTVPRETLLSVDYALYKDNPSFKKNGADFVKKLRSLYGLWGVEDLGPKLSTITADFSKIVEQNITYQNDKDINAFIAKLNALCNDLNSNNSITSKCKYIESKMGRPFMLALTSLDSVADQEDRDGWNHEQYAASLENLSDSVNVHALKVYHNNLVNSVVAYFKALRTNMPVSVSSVNKYMSHDPQALLLNSYKKLSKSNTTKEALPPSIIYNDIADSACFRKMLLAVMANLFIDTCVELHGLDVAIESNKIKFVLDNLFASAMPYMFATGSTIQDSYRRIYEEKRNNIDN